MVVTLSKAQKQESKDCDALNPLKFHLTRPLAKEKGPIYVAFLILSRCLISMQMEYDFLVLLSSWLILKMVAAQRRRIKTGRFCFKYANEFSVEVFARSL